MRVIIIKVLQLAAMLSLATGSLAAEVRYQHPELTIVAQQEPLASVLKSLGREMRIFVTVPTGFNPVVNCDIQNQSIKQALKILLGDISYSLEWEEGGDKLAGLTIFGGGKTSNLGGVANNNSPSMTQFAEQPSAPVGAAVPDSTMEMESGTGAREAQMAEERAAIEARMAQEREDHEAEMELQRQEEEVAHEARMKQEIERHDAETKAYLESQGIVLPE